MNQIININSKIKLILKLVKSINNIPWSLLIISIIRLLQNIIRIMRIINLHKSLWHLFSKYSSHIQYIINIDNTFKTPNISQTFWEIIKFEFILQINHNQCPYQLLNKWIEQIQVPDPDSVLILEHHWE